MYGLNMSENDKVTLQKAQTDIGSKDATASAAGYASQAEVLRNNGIVIPTGNAGANVVPGTPLPASWSGGGAVSYASAAGQQPKSSADVDTLKSLYAPNGGYSKALMALISANNAGVQRAVNDLQAQKTKTEQSYSDLFRQLYKQKKNAQKNIGQQMAAQGVTGGAAESTLLGMETGYSEALRQGQQERIDAQSELDRAITDARLTGDIQNAQAVADGIRDRTNSYAGVLQSMIGRQDTLDRNQIEDERYADQQYDADKADARTRVENMILSYGMKAADIPDVLLELAGLTPEELTGMESYYAAAQAAAAAKEAKKDSPGNYNPNTKLSWSDVEEWVGRYGENAAASYIEEHYKELGYSSVSAAKAGWKNYTTEKATQLPWDRKTGYGQILAGTDNGVFGTHIKEAYEGVRSLLLEGKTVDDVVAWLEERYEKYPTQLTQAGVDYLMAEVQGYENLLKEGK